jgi:quercetin dioxygenase-like cupin family protein
MEESKMKVVDSKTLDWQEPPRGYYLTDVKEKVIWEDEKTGAKMALIKFPVGIADKLHSHPEADQFAYCLSGEVETDTGEKISMEGKFLYFPRGEKHGATKMLKETVGLFYWDGPSKPEIEG